MNRTRQVKAPKDSDLDGPEGEDLRRILGAFLDHLVAERTARGLKQQDLAKLSGLQPGHMSNIETGRRGITLATFIKIARGLGVRPAELAVYLGSLPKAAPVVKTEVVAVITDGTASRQSVHDALVELSAGRASANKSPRRAQSGQAKLSSPQKNRSR